MRALVSILFADIANVFCSPRYCLFRGSTHEDRMRQFSKFFGTLCLVCGLRFSLYELTKPSFRQFVRLDSLPMPIEEFREIIKKIGEDITDRNENYATLLNPGFYKTQFLTELESALARTNTNLFYSSDLHFGIDDDKVPIKSKEQKQIGILSQPTRGTRTKPVCHELNTLYLGLCLGRSTRKVGESTLTCTTQLVDWLKNANRNNELENIFVIDRGYDCVIREINSFGTLKFGPNNTFTVDKTPNFEHQKRVNSEGPQALHVAKVELKHDAEDSGHHRTIYQLAFVNGQGRVTCLNMPTNNAMFPSFNEWCGIANGTASRLHLIYGEPTDVSTILPNVRVPGQALSPPELCISF
jgi:hypothetical protein